MATITDIMTIFNQTTEMGQTFWEMENKASAKGLVKFLTAMAKYGPKKGLGKMGLPVFQNKVTMEDLGLAQRITQDLGSPVGLNSMLRRVLVGTGFNRFDRLNKEVLVNGVIDKLMKQARKWGDPSDVVISGKDIYEKRRYAMTLTDIFGVDENGKLKSNIIEDLKSGKIRSKDGVITNDILELAYNILLDKQPMSDIEMPTAYLDAGGGMRQFYNLKSWSIKQLSVMRDVKLDAVRLSQHKGKKAQIDAWTDLIAFLGVLTVAGMGGTESKDYLLGKDVDHTDHFIENFLRLFIFSRYDMEKILGDTPMKSVALGLLPPFVQLGDKIWSDLNLFEKWHTDTFGRLSDDTDSQKYGYQFPGMVPYVGDFIYNGARSPKFLVDQFGLEGLRGRKAEIQRQIRKYETIRGANLDDFGKIRSKMDGFLNVKRRKLTDMELTKFRLYKKELRAIQTYEKRLRSKKKKELKGKSRWGNPSPQVNSFKPI